MSRTKLPIAREGIPFLVVPTVAAIGFFVGGYCSVALFLLAVAAYVAYFFRDPDRTLPSPGDLLVSPADGRVLSVGRCSEADFCGGGERLRVSVFMNLFDVHVNRFPVDGKVLGLKHHKGLFLDASEDRAAEENERVSLHVQAQTGEQFVLVQVAGLIARRIICYPRVGSLLVRGERMGLIRFGSRCDLYLPTDSEVLVKVGDRVKAGASAIARFGVAKGT